MIMQNSGRTDIVERFFEVIYDLKARKVVGGKKSFCEKYSINRRNFYFLEKEKTSKMFHIEWLTYIVSDYNVSADWLLTGRGEMYTIEPPVRAKREYKKAAGA